MVLTTDRLILRRWHPSDREPFAAMNADPEVMKFFPATLSRAESDAMADRIAAGLDEHGFGFWAIEAPGVAPFIGFAGLSIPRFPAHFMPCVEIGWRLARRFWGRGYASEAARRALQFGFEESGLAEIVAFTVAHNQRSRAVMERIGMRHDPGGDFDHPLVPDGSPVKRHVLYRIRPGIRPRP
jgi:ribosomal-protein-alanine N-acetyltransferase